MPKALSVYMASAITDYDSHLGTFVGVIFTAGQTGLDSFLQHMRIATNIKGNKMKVEWLPQGKPVHDFYLNFTSSQTTSDRTVSCRCWRMACGRRRQSSQSRVP